jgi:23S rRNA (cytosine1962-C5)-methyltransferase
LIAFSFLGGFALHCAAGRRGARPRIGSERRRRCRRYRNAAANGLADKCSFETCQRVRLVQGADTASIRTSGSCRNSTGLFSILLPSRAIRAAVPDAMRGYKEIHLRALKLLKPGGTLATFCCSHHVTR